MCTTWDSEHKRVRSKVNARIGLLGNPSDSFNGKAIAVSIRNFCCEVTCEPSSQGVEFVPHLEHDPSSFNDLTQLEDHVSRKGYYGGIRLLQATCKMFTSQCRVRGVVLHERGFKLSYTTTIPRQAGLSGSSAIICAAFNCLVAWFNIPSDKFPLHERPGLILSVEQDLGITAGLMDRVAQVYGGLVYMDLSREAMEKGYGTYEYLPHQHLPPLWLIYADNPSESGKAHAPVKQRWLEGDAGIIGGMKELADIAKAGRDKLVAGNLDLGEFAALMDRNFGLRRRMYGDAALGSVNIDMVQTAKSVGAGVKFCGSGGAVVALCSEGAQQADKLQGFLEYVCPGA